MRDVVIVLMLWHHLSYQVNSGCIRNINITLLNIYSLSLVKKKHILHILVRFLARFYLHAKMWPYINIYIADI